MAEKLKIIPGEKSGDSFTYDTSKAIEICFNPGKYTVKDTVTYEKLDNAGGDSAGVRFKLGNPRKLSLELMLDTYLSEGDTKEDIRTKYLEPLEKLITLDSELHQPPPAQFLWGSLDFKGYIESMNKTFTLFASDGTPVRATVSLEITEDIPLKELAAAPQNSPDRRKMFVARDGDNIWQMSYRAYGDAAQWRAIADANHIDDPIAMQAGANVIIPVLDAKDRR
ncbi:MAG: hypothetical protein GY940_12105 [bacterium]|nr:hypothetical protein [bacterium]